MSICRYYGKSPIVSNTRQCTIAIGCFDNDNLRADRRPTERPRRHFVPAASVCPLRTDGDATDAPQNAYVRANYRTTAGVRACVRPGRGVLEKSKAHGMAWQHRWCGTVVSVQFLAHSSDTDKVVQYFSAFEPNASVEHTLAVSPVRSCIRPTCTRAARRRHRTHANAALASVGRSFVRPRSLARWFVGSLVLALFRLLSFCHIFSLRGSAITLSTLHTR